MRRGWILALVAAHAGTAQARHAHRPRAHHGASRSQHNGALAIDAARFRRADGTALSVLDDFQGRIGAATCGPRARPRRRTAAALALRSLLCDVVDRHLFNVVLTPNFNRP